MAGEVTPPGTYLRAPAVLERQFAGMCFDQWVKNPQAAVPRRLSEVLDRWAEGADQAKGKFPFDLLSFVENEGERLADEFVAMFKGILDPEAEAIKKTVHSVGFDNILNLSRGKYFDIEINNNDPKKIDELSRKILSNPIIEEYKIKKL